MRNRNSASDQATTAAVAAVAAVSATPFKTAFKVTLGIAAAQFVVLGCFLVGGATLIGTIYFLVK